MKTGAVRKHENETYSPQGGGFILRLVARYCDGTNTGCKQNSARKFLRTPEEGCVNFLLRVWANWVICRECSTSVLFPDVRDGLKPSQRRILVAMNDLNLSPGAQRTKCAKICGETMGNYHPHGDVVFVAL